MAILVKAIKRPVILGSKRQWRHYDGIVCPGSNRGGAMIYILEFLGLLAVAVALAASPLLIRLLDRLFAPDDGDNRSAASYGLSSAILNDRSEMRDEIRRVTNILEADRGETHQVSPPGGRTSK
jgi:hypothetical protein